MEQIDYAKELNELKKEFGDIKKALNKPTSHQLANRRYEKKQNKFVLRIPEHEVELWEHLKSQPNMNQYIKTLIAKDLGYKTWDHFKGIVPSDGYSKDWEAEKQNKQFRSKLMQIPTWDKFIEFIDANELSESEWKEVEKVFNFDEDPSGLAYDLYALGSLPMDAWNKKTIINKVTDILENAPFDSNIEWDKYDEKTLKKKLLKPSNIGGANSKLNSHIKFYSIDGDAMYKLFNLKSPEE